MLGVTRLCLYLTLNARPNLEWPAAFAEDKADDRNTQPWVEAAPRLANRAALPG